MLSPSTLSREKPRETETERQSPDPPAQPLTLLCFKLLGRLRVWLADCSDRHGGIWRWLPETTEEEKKGEDPQSAGEEGGGG